MKEIKSYHNIVFSLDAEGEEHWEIKIVEVEPGEFWGSAVCLNRNLSVRWRKLEATTEQEAFDELVKLSKGN